MLFPVHFREGKLRNREDRKFSEVVQVIESGIKCYDLNHFAIELPVLINSIAMEPLLVHWS